MLALLSLQSVLLAPQEHYLRVGGDSADRHRTQCSDDADPEGRCTLKLPSCGTEIEAEVMGIVTVRLEKTVAVHSV
jgi:hypothetical protein